MLNFIAKRFKSTENSTEGDPEQPSFQALKRYWGSVKKLPWGKWLRFSWVAPTLERLTSIVLKLGTLMLVGFFIVFFLRLFGDQGYVIQSMSVPQQLLEQGYTGQVVALRIQDQVTELKEKAGSVKADSLQIKGGQQDLNLSVLGVGLSLTSLAFQLREVMGRENKTVSGELTRIGNQYDAQIRMTGYDKIDVSVVINDGDEVAALQELFRLVAEGVLYETDPYRLALVQREEKRYDEAIATVRHYLQEREDEAHWAYLCWGTLLRELGDPEEAVEKFERAIELKPDFALPYVNVGYSYVELDRLEDAINAFEKVVELESENIWRRNNLAWAYYRSDLIERADSLCKSTLETVEMDPEEKLGFAVNWAELKLNNQDFPGAKEILDTYVESYDETVASYIIRGVSSFGEQDTMQALAHLQNAFELDPSDPGAAQANIGFNMMLKDYETAIEYYHDTDWEFFNENGEMNSRNQAAMAFNYLEQYDSAYATIERVIAINPNISYPYTTLAETHFFTGQRDSCFYYLEKALEMGYNPENFTMDEAPYDYLAGTLEFQQLLARYQDDEVALKN
ncbi:MAG: tetratricopeptide repeat protein [Bacteroidota bacterium]